MCIRDRETVAQEDFFQAAGTFTVYFHFIKKVVLIFISCFKHGGKSILSRVAGAGGECIEYAVDEYCAEGAAAEGGGGVEVGPCLRDEIVKSVCIHFFNVDV